MTNLRALLLASVCTLGVFATAQGQSLPFDPSMIDQLSPEQKQKAAEELGAGGSGDSDADSGSSASSSPQGGSQSQQGGSRSLQGDNDAQGGSGNGRTSGTYLSKGIDERFSGRRENDSDSRSEKNNSDEPRTDEDSSDQREEKSKALKPFGYELFSRSPNSFAPVTDIPIPEDYVLGPGDVVRLQLFGNQNGSYNLSVNRDGRISFPKLGPIDVAGQHFDEVKTLLEDRVARELIGVQASITLGELRSIRVFLLGDVKHPGSYTVSSLSTITNALIASGGVDPIGSLRKIELKRDGRLEESLDLYDLLLRGDSSHDLRLRPGDVIFVPPVGARVGVGGEVKRPAIYELRGESTVNEVLTLAGGLLASNNADAAKIERYDRNKTKSLIQLNLKSPVALASAVQDGDTLQIGPLAGPASNDVMVYGNVRYPGALEWSPGYTLQSALGAAQPLPSDFSNETYLALGLIERTSVASGIREYISFNVGSVLAKDSAPVALERDDAVVIFSRKDIEFLESQQVRAIGVGNTVLAGQCPALAQLASISNSDRSIRVLKSFSSRLSNSVSSSDAATHTGSKDTAPDATTGTGSYVGDNRRGTYGTSGTSGSSGSSGKPDPDCPAIFAKAPRALPYLLESSVAVYGEVRRPGLYPIAQGTPLQQLVESAGGVTSESDPRNIEYVSYEAAKSAGAAHYETLDLGLSASLPVNPGDVFNFKPTYLGQETGTVRASGEVKFPGEFAILKGERLSELIHRAGGLTSTAFPYGAIFTRASAREAEAASYRRASIELQQSVVTAVSSGALGTSAQSGAPVLEDISKQLQFATPIGRVVIESDPVILQAKPESDPLLEPGDVLFVPKRPISVSVIGQVLNPGAMAFSSGLTVKQYVERAGGLTQAADASRIFVILPNGTARRFKSSFWNFEDEEIPPGSVIVVPRDASPFNALAFSERIFSILSNLAISAASIAVVSRQ